MRLATKLKINSSSVLRQFFKQRLGVDQVRCIKYFGEPAVYPTKQLSGFCSVAPVLAHDEFSKLMVERNGLVVGFT